MGNRFALALTLLTLALLASSAAADFPPITAQEKALSSVAGEPNAPAVVLYRKGVFQMEHVGKQSDSIFTVQARIKVLTEAGKEHGEIVLPHSLFRRLKYLNGRTVLPDGKVLELSDQDVFKRQRSRLDDYYATAAALPGVEVGAILDYEYQLRYRSLYRLVPWHFQSRIPTLHSEISYVVPEHIGFRPWAKVLPDRFHQEIDKQPKRRTLRAWMTDMPSIPEEPFSFPFGDLSNQFMILPTQYLFSGRQIDLLTSWPTVCEREKSFYYDHRKNDGNARKKARELTATASGKREQAAAVYRFVRDEIQLESLYGVFVREGASVDSVIAQGRGDEADKALVLQSMLEALKITTDLVWVADRAGGRKDLNTPNPGWFDRMIVRTEIGGETLFLDPSDRRLGFGHLPPGLEDTEALLYHPRKPEVIRLPVTPWQENRRRAVVELALDDAGRLSGSGSLELAGHHAWREMRQQDDPASAKKYWQEWLEASFGDFTIAGVEVAEAPDERRILVSWSMRQPDEEVLGDEASLRVSRPLGIATNPFDAARRTPVRFAFADRDEVELSLTWSEGWSPDVLPRIADYAGPVGAFIAQVNHQPAERRLSTTWRLDVVQQELGSPALIAAIGDLLSVAENADGQNLVLVRR